jgi:F-type H+-transporting ATPase subunit b
MGRASRKAGWHLSSIVPALLGLVLSVSALYFTVNARAQAQRADAASASGQPAQQSQESPSKDGRVHLGRELARESREAAGEDENAQFKRSAAVQKIASLTGMTVEHAYWLCLCVNFGIVAGAIIWVSKKNLPGVFRSRTTQIQQAMEEARRASADANQRLADIANRLSRLDGEIATMRAAAEKEAIAEEARIKAAAEEDARKIVQAAELEIGAAAKSARRELTAYAASLAVSMAARQMRVDPSTDQGLVRDFATQLANDKSRKGDY